MACLVKHLSQKMRTWIKSSWNPCVPITFHCPREEGTSLKYCLNQIALWMCLPEIVLFNDWCSRDQYIVGSTIPRQVDLGSVRKLDGGLERLFGGKEHLFFRISGFGSQNPHSGLQKPGTPILKDLAHLLTSSSTRYGINVLTCRQAKHSCTWNKKQVNL